ncbi:DNA phosphorothioation-associated putative methyltransferase [Brunnivagina elsteri]|uniref:DNA phosphorothioation-associated methyltransferase n=1 Tax=Brunnivagina elsteri CCALA 953 TaxID=987040 RepID=A0A2A2TL54_9CYAN|nr:DNA phosphorothioation-associated putative methyltransferase [Calothrix elsteri]PAX56181.1 DNA phosphorothioation-associated methyltransferase [Calothrix elsteri CCALA 953]
MAKSELEIERHRAAIPRFDISRPVKLAMECDILTGETTFFDYGCGYGGDVQRTTGLGIISKGWDPYYFPDCDGAKHPLYGERTSADIVNLGYVLNVIEDIQERGEALRNAWKLTQKVLIVSAQVLLNELSNSVIPYGDGIVTRINTFQKYYQQEELKQYIDETIHVDAVPVALGVYFVFRDLEQKEKFKAERFVSRIYIPRISTCNKKFADYQEILQPLMEFYTQRGRLPVKDELENQEKIFAEFRNFNRAFSVILQATDEAEWDAIAYRRSLDIQVYLALSHFDGKRPRLDQLPPGMRQDIKAFFGTYEDAYEVAGDKIFSLGNPEIVKGICDKSKIGKRTRSALYVHVSALQELDPLLRIYERCTTRCIGRIDGATLIKFSTEEPQISYLFYPTFDKEPHPALTTSIIIDWKTRGVTHHDYSKRKNPPVLHRKETFVTPDYPQYGKFARLTQHEEKLGLLDKKNHIGTRDGWLQCLEERGVELKGHRIRYIRKNLDGKDETN